MVQDQYKTPQLPWLYFGCRKTGLGHYLVDEDCRTYRTEPLAHILVGFDTLMAPMKVEPYIYARNELENLGYISFSWWDNSADSRPGANSTLFIPIKNNLNVTEEKDELHLASVKFPWVFDRLPQALVRLKT